MGSAVSASSETSHHGRNSGHYRHHHHPPPYSAPAPHPPLPPPQQQQPPPPPPPSSEIAANRYVFAATAPYPAQYPSPNPSPPPHYYPYGYYPAPPPAMPVPLPGPYHHHPGWVSGGRYPYSAPPPAPAPYVEHQKAVTIRNDVNIKKETLRVEPDEENPGQFLVTFTFDATLPGSITVVFFAKEDSDCNLRTTKEELFKPFTISFEEGLDQKFRQPSGTGIDLSMFDEVELTKDGESDIYPLAVKAEASSSSNQDVGEHQKLQTPNSQITQAIFEKKDNSSYHVRVVKQILWVNGTRYELQEIYGIGNSVDNETDANDSGKECVICLSEPRDTTVLPCRHMCMCSECAKVLRFQTNRCPICRQPVERLLEIKVNNRAEQQQEV